MTNSQSSRAERLAAERASSGRPARPPDGGIDPRAGMRSTTASIHSLHSFDRKSDQVNRPSIGRRIFRTITRFVVTVLIGVGGTLAWQSYGDTAREMVVARAPTLAWLVAPTRSPAVAASPNPAQPALVASNLDAMRRSLDLLTTRQEQVAENLTALLAVEEDVRQKMSFTPPSVATVPTFQPAAPVQQQRATQPKARSSAAQ